MPNNSDDPFRSMNFVVDNMNNRVPLSPWSRLTHRQILSVVVVVWITVSFLAGCDSSPAQSASPEVQTPSSTSIIRFNGICDGSAVVQLSNGNLLFAYDEQNTLFEFSPTGGRPVREHDYGNALGSESEVDVEGAVLVHQHIWWIGSHGNDGSGNRALSRQQLFRTEVVIDSNNQSRVEVVGESVDLLPILLQHGIAAGLFKPSQSKKQSKKGGINIEGLSVTVNDNLLLGLRSPLSSGDVGDAIVAQIDLVQEPPTIVRFHRLELGDRGIRDIQATADGYLLIAGKVDRGGTFSIYRWAPDSKPVWLLDLPDHFNAEALVDTGEHWLVVSDDGKVKRSDESAADGDRRCDKIRRKNPLAGKHPSVFFRAMGIDRQSLQ